ncbi:unnamed protein product, partial [Mesorhabditis spiculigera]
MDEPEKKKAIKYAVLQKHVPYSWYFRDESEDLPPLQYLEKPPQTRCYCDEDCLKRGDCCSDHYETCPPRDCQEGPWSPWSRCIPDKGACGLGKMNQTRQILAEAYGGGRECEPTLAMASCWITCAEDESAHLIDYSYTTSRSFPNETDPDLQPYCDEYEMEMVYPSPRCLMFIMSKKLVAGKRYCAECHPATVRMTHKNRCRGDVEIGLSNFWLFTHSESIYCKGKWKHTGHTPNCRCTRFPDLEPLLNY